MPSPLRRLAPPLVLVALAAACGDAPAPPPPAPATTTTPPPPVEVAPTPPPPPPAPAVTEAPEQPAVLSEKWYATFQDGQRSGWLHVVWTPSTYEGRETVHDRTESASTQTRMMGHVQDVFEASSVTDLERTDDGRLLHQHTVTREPGRETVVEQRWTGDGYVRTATAAGASQRWEIACGEPVPVDGEAFLATRVRAGEVGVGDTFTYPAVNFVAERLETVELKVVGRELVTVPTGTEDCLHVEERVRGIPGLTELWLDSEGVVRRYASASTRLEHTTERRARDVPVGGVSYSITLEAEPFMPRATSFDEAVVELSFPEGAELPDLPDSPFSRVLERTDETIRLRLTAHDSPDATVALPVADEDLARWLRPTLLECSDHPDVRAAARAAIGDETDGRTAATLLLRYVFDVLEKASGPVASPNAAEILRDRGGDCSEHAVLFVALCRAVGLPARRHSGYAQVGHLWGSHAFCEVWLGTWVGADPTTNELGTRARYVDFGGDDDPDAFPGIVSRCMRRCTSIRNVSFQDADESLDVAEMAGDERNDPFSDLRLAEPPEGWRARVRGRSGHAVIRGPGAWVGVRVNAGMGHTPADLVHEALFDSTGELGTLGGRDAVFIRYARSEGRMLMITVPYRRRLMTLDVTLAQDADEDAVLETLAEILAPTFRDG